MSRAGSPPRRPQPPRPTAAQRRRELAETAAVEFHRRGFHQVTLGGVAAAVGVTAPAVYRHFLNKNALLAGAVDSGLEVIEAELEAAALDGDDLDDVLAHLTTAALRRPDFWTLSQREMRYLDDAQQQQVRVRFRGVTDKIADALTRRSPELDHGWRDVLVTAAMAVLSTPSTSHTTLPYQQLSSTLAAAARAASTTTLPSVPPTMTSSTSTVDELPDRATQILDSAVALFHRRGYAAVSLDDIGAATGIAGPSIYHHYDSKADLLVAAFDRILGRLPGAGDTVTAQDSLRRYIDLARREREAIGTYATETINLPTAAIPRIERAIAESRASWTARLRRERPELDDGEAALLVECACSAVHDVVRLGRLHARPHLLDELLAVGTAILSTRTH